ncbi:MULTISPECIES: MarR family winged helix-turn-helix transcriptional regulator [Dethiosulfovibrio]|uniref:Winged helix DNA-binding protein n=3 Tax=Dethiosulfovibrio TaxID=47054 RepID=A0ABS9EPS9_9BACT|nr:MULTISPECIES: MarR family transcriptional regulator [Dethiosulfovibrio]MCF4142276.1 winged helix DNA-binding protein [Dethiosulfovibrio marinus]MCF4144584.1 winged helix DNA-binding protein [Dethiosulfovibrio acidaminovorans]MEA3285672.1 winged helix DNA-binding protein [Synergistota bacterium]
MEFDGNMEDRLKVYREIAELMFSVHNRFKELESKPKDFGTDDLLYSTEIHTIVAVGGNPNSNLTELAELLGVSKSSVSKFVKKLLEKGYIVKTRARDNRKEVFFELTERGWTAYRGHEIFSEKLFGKVYDILKKGEDGDALVVRRFLEVLNEESSRIL